MPKPPPRLPPLRLPPKPPPPKPEGLLPPEGRLLGRGAGLLCGLGALGRRTGLPCGLGAGLGPDGREPPPMGGGGGGRCPRGGLGARVRPQKMG